MQKIVDMMEVMRLSRIANCISPDRRLSIKAWSVVWVTTPMSNATTKTARTRPNVIVIPLKLDPLILLKTLKVLWFPFISLVLTPISGMFIPSFSHIIPVIEIRHIGLYIQERRTIKDVNFTNLQDIVFHLI